MSTNIEGVFFFTLDGNSDKQFAAYRFGILTIS